VGYLTIWYAKSVVAGVIVLTASFQLNEAELEVDSEKASYKQKLGVLQQQEELIEDEEEQEQKEEDARRAKKEDEARMAESLLPDSELHPEKVELEDARMTTEQLKELAEALSVLSAKSSVLKERDELRALMEENLQAEEVRVSIIRYNGS
jgi:LETM1 and EF-hand domain-containing protein 1, mitochondrial